MPEFVRPQSELRTAGLFQNHFWTSYDSVREPRRSLPKKSAIQLGRVVS
jgi:hypothetical protein